MRKQKGFTLIEVIVTIIVAGLAASALFMFLNWSISRTQDAGQLVWELAGATARMERIEGYYRSYMLGEEDNDGKLVVWGTGDRGFRTLAEGEGAVVRDVVGDFPDATAAIEVTVIDERQVLVGYFFE